MVTIEAAKAAVKAGSATELAEKHYDLIAAEDGPNGKGINSFLALSRDRALAQDHDAAAQVHDFGQFGGNHQEGQAAAGQII